MKNLKIVVLLVVMLLLTTGCGGKKLTCKTDNEDMGMEVTMTFKKDTLTKLKAKATMEYDDKKDAKEAVKEVKEDAPKNYKNLKVSSKDKKVIMSFELSAEDFYKELGLEDQKMTYDETKENLVESGYTCK